MSRFLHNDVAATDSLLRQDDSKTTLGFWIYLMTDCMLFAALFATFIVLRGNTYGGPAEHDLYRLPFVLTETLILLASSYACGLAVLAAHRRNVIQTVTWLAVAFILGVAFLTLEFSEFSQLVSSGHSWRESGSLTAFFTLVGTHGLHITIGLIWMVIMAWQLLNKGVVASVTRRLTLFSMFWHFLDVVWIFIFTIVYLIGAL